LRRWTRVFFNSLRCFFFAMRLRRFLMTEPTENLRSLFVTDCRRAVARQVACSSARDLPRDPDRTLPGTAGSARTGKIDVTNHP
jgi:hypothetical protein